MLMPWNIYGLLIVEGLSHFGVLLNSIGNEIYWGQLVLLSNPPIDAIQSHPQANVYPLNGYKFWCFFFVFFKDPVGWNSVVYCAYPYLFLLNVEKKGDVITHSEVFMPQAFEDYKQDNM